MTNEHDITRALKYAAHRFASGDNCHKTIFAFAQALQGTDTFKSREYTKEVQEAFNRLFDETLVGCIEYEDALPQFRDAWLRVKHPTMRQDPKAVREIMNKAAKDPPELAKKISNEFYRGSPRMAQIISMSHALSVHNVNGLIMMPARTVAAILELSDWRQSAAWIRQLATDEIITKIKEGKTGKFGRSPHYVWSYRQDISQIKIPSVAKKSKGKETKASPVNSETRAGLMRMTGVNDPDRFDRIWKRCVDLHEGFEDFSPRNQVYELQRATCDIPI